MSELNGSQREIAETLDGMLVVDAGPGTGKTKTIVHRYINLISREDVGPGDVLLLTFTNNAAAEMEERIKNQMAEEDMIDESKLVQARTFDSFCLSIVMDSPELAGNLLGLRESLTRGATIVQNDTLNYQWFGTVLDDFLARRGEDYGKWASIGSECQRDLMNLINRLMSRGVFPMRRGWFGLDAEGQLLGDMDAVLADMESLNTLMGRAKGSEMVKALRKMDPEDSVPIPDTTGGTVDEEDLRSAAFEDRSDMLRFVHDLYLEYAERSVASDRLTFGLTSMLALTLLYDSKAIRERNSYRYVMIDEFQDTNACQLMTALMILKEPNLCVVGDWKQGIYGFRFVSIDNIVDFENRAVALRRFLNDDVVRVGYQIPGVTRISLDTNYRSSQEIVDMAFECMFLKGSKEDEIDRDAIESELTRLKAGRTDIGDRTGIRFVRSRDKHDEAREVVRCIRDYVGSGGYAVCDGDDVRPMELGDIAVICRSNSGCAMVQEALEEAGIPSFLQGDVELMSTREGKLALAWLRFVNNVKDPWGYIPIMVDMGYSLADCDSVKSRTRNIPLPLLRQRHDLYVKRRRVTNLLTSLFEFHGLDNDRTQAIISILSGTHRDSLLTISDLVRMIEEDIARDARYPVENSVDRDAVTVMTMHKAKGLEFPAVILPFIDIQNMPLAPSDRVAFTFSERSGVRCTKDVHDFGGYRKIVSSWRTALVKASETKDYSEERRLMFVAMSRAKQYETLICSNPSKFMEGLCSEYTEIPPAELPEFGIAVSEASRPHVPVPGPRPRRMGVHAFMGMDAPSSHDVKGFDERCGKGREYGVAVHDAAELLFHGIEPDADYPELDAVRNVIAGVPRGSSMAEVDCTLPVDGTDVILKGRIDLVGVFDDRIEIHDYKTDSSDAYQDDYVFQLSVYALAAGRHFDPDGDKRIRCIIDYVSLGRSFEFEPLDMEQIRERVLDRLAELDTHPDCRGFRS